MKVRMRAWTSAESVTWENSKSLARLYRSRCRQEVEEMECHSQAAEILQPYFRMNDGVLDVGCGSGYFFHSLKRRIPRFSYTGVDPCKPLLDIGKKEMPQFGLSASNLICSRMEECVVKAEHIVCINVLTYLENFHKILDRCFLGAQKTVLLRESIWEKPSHYQYVIDRFLDRRKQLRVHINTYNRQDLRKFGKLYGFDCKFILDRRSCGKPEMSIGYPHRWGFLLFRKARS